MRLQVESAAHYPNCAYPGVVVVSHCWHTHQHPDPTGSMGRQLAVYLHWYAAQRARFTKERLYDASQYPDNESYRIQVICSRASCAMLGTFVPRVEHC